MPFSLVIFIVIATVAITEIVAIDGTSHLAPENCYTFMLQYWMHSFNLSISKLAKQLLDSKIFLIIVIASVAI